jgi:hypothetical protein
MNCTKRKTMMGMDMMMWWIGIASVLFQTNIDVTTESPSIGTNAKAAIVRVSSGAQLIRHELDK